MRANDHSGRAEIHFHLLPGVDDGPRELPESLALARAAVADGTSLVLATPHVRDTSVPRIHERTDELRAALAAHSIPLEVHPGGELGARDLDSISDADLQAIAAGPPRRRWVLLEPPFDAGWEELAAAVERLRRRGFYAVLAHPERCAALRDERGWAALVAAAQRGVVLQVNAHSLLGRHGPEARQRAARLVRERLPVALASDAHSLELGPALSAAYPLVEALSDRAYARLALDTGPRALVERGALPAQAPAPSTDS